jgi:hypothetical protein
MARRGRGGGNKEKLRGIRPLHAIKPTRKLGAVSRFGSVFRPRSMAALLDGYAKEQDRLAGKSPPEPPHAAAPQQQAESVRNRSEPRNAAPRPVPASLWQRMWAWLSKG